MDLARNDAGRLRPRRWAGQDALDDATGRTRPRWRAAWRGTAAHHRPERATTELELHVRDLLRKGDADGAATAVLEALGPGVLRQLVGMLPHDDGHDAFSAFQLDVWRGLHGFRWECSLRGWVHRLARHAAARVGRDGYRRRKEPLPADLASALATPDHAESEGHGEELASLRDELTAEERTLLTLRVGRELAWHEVSAALAAEGEAISSAALRKRFERLKGKLVTLARARGVVG